MIFRFHNSWVSDFSGEISPLPSTVLSEEDYALRFYAPALSSAKIGTDIFAIPLEYDGLLLFYNKDLFEAALIQSPNMRKHHQKYLQKKKERVTKRQTPRV